MNQKEHDFCIQFLPWLPSGIDPTWKCKVIDSFLSDMILVRVSYYSDIKKMESSFDHISVMMLFQR